MITEKQKQILLANNKKSQAIAQESIEEAFFQMLDKKNYEKITITDIIRRSGISRSAFYRNYKTKEAVLESSVTHLIERILRKVTGDVRADLYAVLKEISDHQSQIRLLFSKHLDYILLDALNRQNFPRERRYNHIIWSGIIFNSIYTWTMQQPETDYKKVANQVYGALQSISTQKVAFLTTQD